MSTVNRHASLQSRQVAIEDRVAATTRQAVAAVLSAVRRHAEPQGCNRITVEAKSMPSNTIDGKAVFLVKAWAPEGDLAMDLEVALRDGVPVLTEQRVLDELAKVRAELAKRVDLGETEVATMAIDFSKVTAKRAGDLVLYTSPELPRWNLPVAAESLKTEDGRKEVLAAVVNSIGIYCLSDFGVQASLKTEVRLPVVQANEVRAAARPAAPEFDIAADLLTADPSESLLAGVRVVTPAKVYTPHELRAMEFRTAFESRIRKTAAPALLAWVRAQGGGAGEVISWNLGSAEDSATGSASGKVVATLRFYTNTSREVVELEGRLNADGTLDPASLAKTADQLKFEADRKQEFSVKTEEEAKAELARFQAQRQREANTEAAILANLGLEAGGENVQQGQNFLNKPVANRIPILKALLPADAATAGKKIQLNGYVYQLAETNYNNISGDPVHSAFLMACLTDEVPTDKIPTMGLWGSRGAVFSSRR